MPAQAIDQQLVEAQHMVGELNSILGRARAGRSAVDPHFNQNEELFIQLTKSFVVPSLPIHHDVRKPEPGRDYQASIATVLEQLVDSAPGIFSGVTYYFDPADVLKMRFFQPCGVESDRYLYLQSIDLAYRAQEHEVLVKGTNDRTPEYRSSRLFVEGLVVPLSGSSGYQVRETFSQTWLGERGRGYFVQGIWIDHDLTKFFSKLFLPHGSRLYPFYPFVCRYRTVCETLLDFSLEERQRRVPDLHQALRYIEPATKRIQSDLRESSFSEDLPVFQELKGRLPARWKSFYTNLRMVAYLNDRDMKEFRVERTADGP
jgi:hypothetical protein